MIIGGDGKEYGPVPVSEVNGWIANGRANLQTRAKKLEGDEVWKTLGDFPEFSPNAALPPPPLASIAATPPIPADPKALADDLLARAPKLAIGACLSRGWDLWMDHFGQFMLLYLFFIPISVALTFVQFGSLPVASLILSGVFTAGMYRYTLKLLHGEPASVSDLFAGFSEAPGALISAGIAIAVLTILGCFLILPGIYLGIAWTFTYPLILEKNLPFLAGDGSEPPRDHTQLVADASAHACRHPVFTGWHHGACHWYNSDTADPACAYSPALTTVSATRKAAFPCNLRHFEASHRP